MFIGIGRFDLLLGTYGSLKAKRSTVRRLTADLAQKFAVAVAETDYQDLLQRAEISITAVSASHSHCERIIQNCEDYLAKLPEHELLAARIRVISDNDV